MDLARLFLMGAVTSALGACVSLEGLTSQEGEDAGGAPSPGTNPGHSSSGGGGESSSSSSGSGATSSSSSSSSGGAPGDSGLTACPGKPAPPGVRVGTYCVDSTEVTNEHYSAFLNDVGPTPASGSQLPECAFNVTYLPAVGAGPPTLPITAVNWCQAQAYCKWAGKRLCGNISGGSIDPKTSAWKDSNADQWFRACTFAGARTYPYGTTYAPNACNGSDVSFTELALVKAFPRCEGGYAGIFDMSGNVREWQDSCDGTGGPNDKCRTRGGAADNGQLSLTCDQDEMRVRSDMGFRTGFRCCSL